MATGEQSGEMVKVEKLEPRSRQVNTVVKVVNKGAPRETVSRTDGTVHRVSDVLVGDETAVIYMSLWDENIDRVDEGDTIAVKNGYVSLFRGSMRLNVGRFGSFEKAETEIEQVNTSNNLSERQFEQERRYPVFQPLYRGERSERGEERGGYGGRGRRGYRPRRRY
ncbi:MAG: single-stranded DNA-binding protein [Candidatus Bathyarchaeia archaeon]